MTNSLFVDIGDAIAFVQDGFQSLHPIVKLMLYEDATRSVLQQPAAPSPKVEAKKLDKPEEKVAPQDEPPKDQPKKEETPKQQAPPPTSSPAKEEEEEEEEEEDHFEEAREE